MLKFELTIRTFWDHFDERQRSVIQHDAMTSLVYRADTVLYDVSDASPPRGNRVAERSFSQEILEFLHSQTLQPIPSQTFASLRQLADAMENVTIVSLQAFAPAFVGPRIELSARLGHLITRHLGICSLVRSSSAQNARRLCICL
jgi:regulatory factor X